MKRTATILRLGVLAILCLYSISHAEPQIEWIRTYEDGGEIAFNDIYHCSDNGFAICGKAGGGHGIILKTDSDGGEEWRLAIGDEENPTWLSAIIELDGGDFTVVGSISYPVSEPYAARISSGGEIIWEKRYRGASIHAVIELKAGTLMLGGRGEPGFPNGKAWLVEPDDGEVIWERVYENDGFNEITGLRETGDRIFAAGTSFTSLPIPGDPRHRNYYFFEMVTLKIDPEDGEPRQWHHYQTEDIHIDGGDVTTGLTSCENGFALSGYYRGGEAGQRIYAAVRTVESDGDEIVYEIEDFDWDVDIQRWASVCRMPNQDLVLVGYGGVHRNQRPTVIWMSSDGVERWHTIYDMPELGEFETGFNDFTGVVPTGDGGVVACGGVLLDNGQGYAGLLVKLEPLIYEPTIYYCSPEDSSISVLIGDSVYFEVRAHDPLDRAINYLWTNDGEEISSDSTCQIEFTEIGQPNINCQVTIDELSANAHWLVNVTDLYISDFTPDTLNLTLRRGVSIDFSLDTIRFTDGADPEYLWTKTNLANGQTENSGEEAQATIDFPWSGDYTVEGAAYRGESRDAVLWNVAVRGVIWAFVPESDNLNVPPDSLIHLEVMLSEPENDSLAIEWLMDGELVRDDTTAIDLMFSPAEEGRRYQIHAIVADSVESDTVTWTVNVTPLGVGVEDAGRPGRPALLDVSPNPFNSTVTLRYVSPINREATRLSIHDITGREVANFDGRITPPTPPAIAGGDFQTFVWDASAFPAGIYFARLDTGSEISTVKMVLVR